jgi:nucleoside-diphosphate-sugar epimerase
MKVAVTGTGSLLMSSIVKELIRRGDDVVCIQRRRVELLNCQQELIDIRDADGVRRATVGCDAIIHGAAKVGIMGTYEEFHSVNVEGTMNVVNAAHLNNISRLVFVSTPSVTHTGTSLVGALADHAVTGRSHSHYAETKAKAELLVLSSNSDSLSTVALRPHLVWGPGDTQLVGRIIERASQGKLVMVGSGNALVDSTYIDNAADAHISALDALHNGAPCAGNAYVIANGEPRTVNELIRGMCDAAGVSFSPKHVPLAIATRLGTAIERIWPLISKSEPPLTRFVAEQLGTAHWFDPRPAQADLAWSPSVSIDEGFQRLHNWFTAQK